MGQKRQMRHLVGSLSCTLFGEEYAISSGAVDMLCDRVVVLSISFSIFVLT